MKVKLILLIFLFFVFYTQLQVESAVMIERTAPENCTAHCCGSRTGPMKLHEEKVTLSGCAKAVCRRDRTIRYTSCVKKVAVPPCYVDKGDSSKPYPECCPQIYC